MKRSRIFLGLTTVCLAIAGVVAAKAHFGLAGQAYYYTLVNGKVCTHGATTGVYFTFNSTTQYNYVTIANGTLIPSYISQTCKRPLDFKVKA